MGDTDVVFLSSLFFSCLSVCFSSPPFVLVVVYAFSYQTRSGDRVCAVLDMTVLLCACY